MILSSLSKILLKEKSIFRDGLPLAVSQPANAQIGKTQFFETPCTSVRTPLRSPEKSGSLINGHV